MTKFLLVFCFLVLMSTNLAQASCDQAFQKRGDIEVANQGMPKPEADGFFVRTLNNQGFMGARPSDPFMQAFIAFASDASGPVLDIGAAYGVASVPALKKGAMVIANDVDSRHLEILREQVSEELRANLTLMPGKFPEGLNIEKETLGAVLIARVLHFFKGPQIEEAASRVFSWLKPGGKVFVTAETVYLKNIASFIPIYEARVASGERWPGYVEDFSVIDQRAGYNLPKSMHLLDSVVLRRVFSDAGFEVERSETFARPEFPETLRYDGRESVGIIATKPF